MTLSTVFFWGIPILALIVYILLFIFFLFAKKDTSLKLFLVFLGASCVWVASSLLMKMEAPPGPLFWNKTMVTCFFCIPYLIYLFFGAFTKTLKRTPSLVWGIVTVICIILNSMGYVVTDAQMLHTENGLSSSFSYTLGILAIPCTAILYSICILLVFRARAMLKDDRPDISRINHILVGLVFLCTGLALNLIPAIGQYPVDILFSVIYAFLIIVSIYKHRMFELRFIFTKGSVLFLTFLVLATAYVFIIMALQRMLAQYYPQIATVGTIILALFFALILQPIFVSIQRLIDKIFLKAEYVKRQALNSFSINIANRLDLKAISEELIDAVKTAISCNRVSLMLRQDHVSHYVLYRSSNQVDTPKVGIRADNPIIDWLTAHDECLLVSSFDQIPSLLSMWDSEKRDLTQLDAEVIVPIKCRGKLIGLLLLSKKQNGGEYSFEDLELLTSLGASSAVAIDNAYMFSKAQAEARLDALTGIYNNRYFHTRLEEAAGRTKNGSCLSLITMDLDMFKLYNDIHGHYVGDEALKKVAAIIKNAVGGGGIPCRYGGEEFVVIMPFCDAQKAYVTAEKIRYSVEETFRSSPGKKSSKSLLTVSIGLCTMPDNAPSADELHKRADLALFKAKSSGKNQTVVYNCALEEDDGSGVSVHTVAPAYATTIYALTAAIDAKDHFTAGHSENVAFYTVSLAKAIGLDRDHIRLMGEAALLHDIGKIGIPEHILSKKEPLNHEEYEIMKTHVEISASIIKHLPSTSHVLPAVYAHHERWDGNGYPRGLSGEHIPLTGRCLAIADSFDAMVSTRPYKKQFTTEFALNELITQAGKQFDPELAHKFVSLVKNGTIAVRSYNPETSGHPIITVPAI